MPITVTSIHLPITCQSSFTLQVLPSNEIVNNTKLDIAA